MKPAFGAQAALAVALAAPLVMIPARVAAPTLLLITTALLTAGLWRSGRLGATVARLQDGVRSPLALALIAFLALATASLLWTPALARGGTLLAHMIGTSALLALCLAAVATERPILLRLAPATMLVVASVVLVADLRTGGGLRAVFGAATEPFRLNRAAVAIVLLLPLAGALPWQGRGRGRGPGRGRWALVPLWAVCAFAAFASDSESAKLVVPVSGLALAIAIMRPVLGIRLVTAVAVIATAAIPFVAPFVAALIPEAVRSDTGFLGITIRADIWATYAGLIGERPLVGFGIEAGHVAASLPETAGYSQERRDLLSWGHPHNGALQIWFELGAAGAALACLVLWSLGRALERHAGPFLPATTATFAAAYAVFFVSHGAWQAWWWALLALVAVLYAAAICRRDDAGPRAC